MTQGLHLPHIVFDVAAYPSTLSPGTNGGFAVAVSAVCEVLDVLNALGTLNIAMIVPVPLAPGLVRGIINHNGRIVTIVDPAPLLGLPNQGASAAQVLLLSRDGRRKGNLGLLVQRIREIVPYATLAPVEVQAGPCIAWVANVKQRLIHVVAVEPLLQRLGEQFSPGERGQPLGAGL